VDREGRALRKVALVLASKLSQRPWVGLEDGDVEGMESKRRDNRIVAVFFNTIRQALLASQELKLLQRQSKDHRAYDAIQILCLGHDSLPTELITRPNTKKRRNKNKFLQDGTVDPHNGLLLIVQPSDLNAESSHHPSPAIHTLTHLQRILARASVAQLPAIVLSPRLNEQQRRQLVTGGMDQSGYQRSSTYGGVEPPKGPTPWILRDFIPPVYSWVGSALGKEDDGRRRSNEVSSVTVGSLLHRHAFKTTSMVGRNRGSISSSSGKEDASFPQYHYSRIALCQSVMESGHPWRLFVVGGAFHRDTTPTSNYLFDEQGSTTTTLPDTTAHQYIASTSTSSGRPTQDILHEILSVWILQQQDQGRVNDDCLPDQ